MIDGEWITSSFSSGHGQCVQAKIQAGVVHVRDSQQPALGELRVEGHEWGALMAQLKPQGRP